MEINVGDTVVLRDDLINGKLYGNNFHYYDKMFFKKEIVKKIQKNINGFVEYFTIENNDWAYTKEMIKEVIPASEEFKIGDVVKLKYNLIWGVKYGDVYFLPQMQFDIDKIDRLNVKGQCIYYELSNGFSYSKEMLKKVSLKELNEYQNNIFEKENKRNSDAAVMRIINDFLHSKKYQQLNIKF